MVSANFLRILKTINWTTEAVHKKITQEEMRKKYEALLSTGYKLIDNKNSRKNFTGKEFFLEKKNGYRNIYVMENEKYNVYFTHELDDGKNSRERITGAKAVSLFFDKFNELNGCNKKGFNSFFGNSEEEIKKCVPKGFYFKNLEYQDRIIKNVSAVDFCSHYSSSAMGDLPDANHYIKLKGIQSPTPVYPFAFYPVSGNCSEYKKFNTRIWHFSDFEPFLCDSNKIDFKKEYTILMKKSEKTLDKTFEWFYNRRKENENYKTVMNATIGMFHTKSYAAYRYAHIAAIAIARANQATLKLAEKIGINNILQICVDGIIYKGNENFGVYEKGLQKLHQEYAGAEIKIRGMNCYVVKNANGSVIKVKHGAFNANADNSEIVEENVKDYSDMYGWKRIDPLEGW